MSKLSIRAGSGKKKKGDSKKAGGGKDLRICSEMCSAFCLQPSGPSGPNLARRSGLAWGVGGWGSFFFGVSDVLRTALPCLCSQMLLRSDGSQDIRFRGVLEQHLRSLVCS